MHFSSKILTKQAIILHGIIACLLFIPWLAMKFTNEVSWGIFDFILAYILLLSGGLGVLIFLNSKAKKTWKIAGIILLFVLLLLWIELAVGLFGSPIAGN